MAAAKKDYIPIGIDIRLEFCETARKVLHANGKTGYSLVADLQNLPFLNNVFNVVWSFSVIQHTHLDRFTRCLSHIERILEDKACCFLEFPNRNGIRNRFGPAAKPNNSDFDSWMFAIILQRNTKKSSVYFLIITDMKIILYWE